MFDSWADISNAQAATVNLVALYFQLTLTVKYIARYSYYFVVSEINITT